MQKTLGEIIRENRLNKKIGIRQLAKTISVSPSLICLIEKKSQSSIGYEKMKMLCHTLELDLDEILALSGKIAKDVKEIILQQPSINSNKIRQFDTFR